MAATVTSTGTDVAGDRAAGQSTAGPFEAGPESGASRKTSQRAGRRVRPLPPGTSPTRWHVLIFLCCLHGLATVDLGAIALALPSMSTELLIDPVRIVGVQCVALVAASGWAGVLSDRYGRKRVLMFGAVLSIAASIATVYAQSEHLVLAVRAAAGVAGAFLVVGTSAAMVTLFRTTRERRLAFTGLFCATAAAFGATFTGSGWLVAKHSWTWMFVAFAVIAAVGGAGTAAFMTESRDPQRRSTDPAGSAILAFAGLGLAGVVAAMTGTAGVGVGMALLVVTAGFVGLFLWWERRSALPLIDRRLGGARRFWASNVVSFSVSMVLGAFVALMIQYLTTIGERSPARTGVVFIAMSAGAICSTWATLRTLGTRGHRTSMSKGLIVVLGSALWTAGFSPGTRLGAVVAVMFLMGVGWGNVAVLAAEKALTAIPERIAGVGAGLMSMSRHLGVLCGSAIGLQLAAVRFSESFHTQMADYPVPEFYVDLAGQSVTAAWWVAAIADGMYGEVVGDMFRDPAVTSFLETLEVAMRTVAVPVAWCLVLALWLMPGPEHPEPEHSNPGRTRTRPDDQASDDPSTVPPASPRVIPPRTTVVDDFELDTSGPALAPDPPQVSN